MITVPAGIRVLVATQPVDFCRRADSLAALVREQLKHDPFSGTIYIFRSRRADRLKITGFLTALENWPGTGPGWYCSGSGLSMEPSVGHRSAMA
jgi:transposase